MLHLAVPLELIPQPLKVRISPAHTGLLHTEHGQICLQMTESIIQINICVSPLSHLEPDLVVCVSLAGDPVGDRVDDVNLEKVSRGGVCVIQGLLLAARKNNRLCKQCLRWKKCHEHERILILGHGK